MVGIKRGISFLLVLEAEPVHPVAWFKMYRSRGTRAVDPHSLFADPDPAVLLNADPDLDPA